MQQSPFPLLLLEAETVGTLFHSGVALMGAHLDLRKRAVVLSLAVMGTLADGTGNGLVGIMTVHDPYLLHLVPLLCPAMMALYRKKSSGPAGGFLMIM